MRYLNTFEPRLRIDRRYKGVNDFFAFQIMWNNFIEVYVSVFGYGIGFRIMLHDSGKHL